MQSGSVLVLIIILWMIQCYIVNNISLDIWSCNVFLDFRFEEREVNCKINIGCHHKSAMVMWVMSITNYTKLLSLARFQLGRPYTSLITVHQQCMWSFWMVNLLFAWLEEKKKHTHTNLRSKQLCLSFESFLQSATVWLLGI